MRIVLPSLAQLSSSERRFVGTVLSGLAEGCRARGRPALAVVFTTLAEAVSSPKPRRFFNLESLADLDDGELDDLARVLQARQSECRRKIANGEAAFHGDVLVGLAAERERRRTVFVALDQAITWYERNTSL